MAVSTEAAGAETPGRRWEKPPLGPRTLTILFVAANVILVALPLVPQLFLHGKGKDYPLWWAVGHQVLTGGDLYHDTGHGFGFLYPPFAALLLAPFAAFGRAFSIFCIGLVNVASWWAAAKLSDRLAGVPGPKAWWMVALPSVIALPFIWDMYDLGQPNLMLLAIMLAGLALMARRREWPAGLMFGAAAALKAFPIAIFPYLLWRRRWKAAASMAIFTAFFLLLAPAPFRGLERNLAEVKTWAGGMVFSANEKGFGQRPEQNWGWKNNSLIAMVHRYTRPINAEAEHPEYRPIYVNVLNLTYDQANIVLAVVAGIIGLGFVALLPPQRRRTPASDGAEYALLIALITIASPLARAYYFVWLLYPFTVLVYRAALDPDRSVRRWSAGLLAASLALFTIGVSIGPPHILQALGNMFWATAIIIGALAWLMRRSMAPSLPPLAGESGEPREASFADGGNAAIGLPASATRP
ncbi:MAG TPA: glycosyltransferase family 87 protein [Caulobacteraceae bacterium]|nr:glycosyltransferase family 87 protein [Caulobacteraceae bacterium]